MWHESPRVVGIRRPWGSLLQAGKDCTEYATEEDALVDALQGMEVDNTDEALILQGCKWPMS